MPRKIGAPALRQAIRENDEVKQKMRGFSKAGKAEIGELMRSRLSASERQAVKARARAIVDARPKRQFSTAQLAAQKAFADKRRRT